MNTFEWLLIFFIHDDNFEFSALKLNTLPKVEINEKVKLILIHNKRIFLRKLDESETGLNSIKEDLVYYRTIIKTLERRENEIVEVELKELITWKEGFEYLFANYSAKKIGLYTLSHAAGIVINRNNVDLISQTYQKSFKTVQRLRSFPKGHKSEYIALKLDNFQTYYTLKTITFKEYNAYLNPYPIKYIRNFDFKYCKNYEGLFTFEFAQVLTQFLNGKKLAFIVFSNCNMLLYDNGFLFNSITENIIASQSYSDPLFSNPRVLVETVYENTEVSSDEMAKLLFSNFIEKDPIADKSRFYFLLSTKDFNKIHGLFNDFLESLIKELIGNQGLKQEILKLLRTNLLPSTSDDRRISFIDVVNLFDRICSLPTIHNISNLKNLSLQFQEMFLSNLVISRSQPDTDHQGLSIYLPLSKEHFEDLKGPICNYFNKDNPNWFLQSSAYDEFIMTLYS